MPRPRCGNDPRAQLAEGDRQAIADFRAYLTRRAQEKTMSDLSRKVFLAETAAVREHLAEQEQPAAARAALRHRIAEALDSLQGTAHHLPPETRQRVIEVVAAGLPAPVDRAAVYREAADDLAAAFGDPMAKHIGALGASFLRRRARDIEAGRTTEARRMAVEAQPTQPQQDEAPHAPGTAILCPDCRIKGHAVCTAAGAQQDGAQS